MISKTVYRLVMIWLIVFIIGCLFVVALVGCNSGGLECGRRGTSTCAPETVTFPPPTTPHTVVRRP